MYLVFPRLPDKSYGRRFRVLFLCSHDVSRAPVNSLCLLTTMSYAVREGERLSGKFTKRNNEKKNDRLCWGGETDPCTHPVLAKLLQYVMRTSAKRHCDAARAYVKLNASVMESGSPKTKGRSSPCAAPSNQSGRAT